MKKVIKIVILFLLALTLNILFSNKLYAFEWTTKISQENISPGDEFYIEVSLDCSALNGFKSYISVSDTDCIEIVYNEDGSMKTEQIKDGSWDGNWKFRAFFKAKKDGTSNIKINIKSTSFFVTWDEKEADIKVTIGKSNEQKEVEKEIKDGQDFQTRLENAYKTIPASDADAETIDIFIKSESHYNKGKKFTNNEISLDIVKKWDETLKNAQIDNISRLNYQPQRDVLNEYINKLNEKENNLNTRIDTSSKQAGETIDANNQTIKNAKIKLSILAGSKGSTRTENVFKDDVLDDPNTYKPSNSNSKDDSEAATIIDKILSFITTIGTVISVLMLAILGIKYMLGSVEEKAEYKKDLVPYFIGAALLFGICTVVKILQSLGDTINNL